jgi:hypothetical protein
MDRGQRGRAPSGRRLPAAAIVHSLGMADMSDAEKVEIIHQILAEPIPKWFQNPRRRANSYAEQLQRIAKVINGSASQGGA